MARYNRALAVRPVNSIKHVVDTSGVVTSTISTTEFASAVDTPARLTQPDEVHNGSVIKWFYAQVETAGSVAYAGVPRVYCMFWKNPGNELVAPSPASVGSSDVRKFVFHQEMQMVAQQTTSGAGGGDGTFPRTMFKGVIRVPKRYQRMGINDRLSFSIQNEPGESTGTTRFCFQCIYKEFF